MKEEIRQLQTGNYGLPFPPKNDNVCLPNNTNLAMSRLIDLKKKFNDSKYFTHL